MPDRAVARKLLLLQKNRQYKVKADRENSLSVCFFVCPVPSGLPHRSHCVPINMNRYGFEVFSFFKSNLKYHRFAGLLNIMLNEKVFASCAVLCRDF